MCSCTSKGAKNVALSISRHDMQFEGDSLCPKHQIKTDISACEATDIKENFVIDDQTM